MLYKQLGVRSRGQRMAFMFRRPGRRRWSAAFRAQFRASRPSDTLGLY
jgi:hypothetical protein